MQSQYEEPTPQTIFIQGQESFKTVSIPGLQKNYTNVNGATKETGSFRISQYDFPAFDDFEEIFGQKIQFQINIKLVGLVHADSGIGDSPYTATSGLIDGFPGKAVTNIRYFDAQPMTVSVSSKLCTVHELLRRIQDAILTTRLHTDYLEQNPSSFTDTDTARFQQIFSHHFKSLYMDTDTQKVTMELLTPSLSDKSRLIAFENSTFGPTYVRWISVGGFFVEFAPTAGQSYSEDQAELFAALLGGDVTVNGTSTQFSVQFPFEPVYPADGPVFIYSYTYPTLYEHVRIQATATAVDPEFIRTLTQGASTYSAVSQNIPRMFISEHVFIRGTPEVSYFKNTGQSQDVVDILPRNRMFGTIPDFSNTLPVTQQVTTSMASLRAINMAMCDSRGRLIKFGGQYTIKLIISF